MMRRWLVILLLAVSPPAAAAQNASLVDRIVAVVNKEVITLSELNEAVSAAERQLRRQGTPAPERPVLERQLLERLILEKAQLQMARDSGIRVDDLQLDRAVQRIAQNNNMTLADFRRALERDGVVFDTWREELRDQILLSRLREREVDDKVQVSDSEIDLFLEEMKTQPERAEYNVSHVLVRIPEQASPERIEAARAKAEKALAEARSGTDFAAVAASYSDAPDAISGGALGWRSHERLPEVFAAVLAKMKPGEVSEVLRSPAGFHLLKLIDRRGLDAGAPVTQTRARHILIRTSEVVSESEARRRLADLRERIVSGAADFGEMARVHSDDNSAARGGELDWIYPGDSVPDFERALNELKVGEISQPVKTPFGYHLIQVLERRSADMSPERRRLQARQALRERKSEEAYQEWLRQVRDQAYVELRLEEK
ncbi:MAG: molecular chaperone SurA [Betaproteobacteria bacterium]|nr:MAG: molecular chaperone SurA [Betaproteobacteria bacterium]